MGLITRLRPPDRRARRRVGVVLPLEPGESPHSVLARVQDAELALRMRVHRAVEVRAGGDAPEVRPVLNRQVQNGALVGLTWGCLAAAGAIGTQDAPFSPLDADFWTLVLLVVASCAFWAVAGALVGGLFKRRSVTSSGLADLADRLPTGQHAVLLSVTHGDGHSLVAAVAPQDGRVTRISPVRVGPAAAPGRHPRLGWWAAWTAAALAFAYAAVSLFWGVGGTLGLDTVGGAVVQLATESPALAQALALVAALLKLLGGGLALALVQRWGRSLPRRLVRVGATLGGIGLTAYGGLYVVAGALVLMGALDSPGADRGVLAWHVGLWDLWFLLWGVALLLAVWATRGGRQVAAGDAPAGATGRTPRPR